MRPGDAAGPDMTEALAVWTRVAALSFGGPAGQIAVMHRIVVEEKRWIDERRFLHALNFCMLLPGPEAHQLAIYLGWMLNGVRGGLAAGVLFVLPGFLAIMALSAIYVAWGQAGPAAGLFFGLKAAVLAIVIQAVARIGRRALDAPALRALAATAFLAIFAFGVPFPAIILAAALAGWFGANRGLNAFARHQITDTARCDTQQHGDTWRAALAMAALWLAPVAVLLLWLGSEDTFAQLAKFFSQMAVVTFGGAYAVLAYVAQQAVETHAWLAPGEMLDGLGLAETTPGPLIIVVQFVGFLAAFRNPGGLDPWVAAVIGATLVSWVTFVPSFLWIFLAAPHVERARNNPALAGALRAITAAVVGVILNLAIWFALHFVFTEVGAVRFLGLRLDMPVPASLDPAALVLSALALIAVLVFGVRMVPLLIAAAGLGLGWSWLSMGG